SFDSRRRRRVVLGAGWCLRRWRPATRAGACCRQPRTSLRSWLARRPRSTLSLGTQTCARRWRWQLTRYEPGASGVAETADWQPGRHQPAPFVCAARQQVHA
ncbi:hypothetical protein T484DRAFT_1899276, partial [Baffinella frigidus]